MQRPAGGKNGKQEPELVTQLGRTSLEPDLALFAGLRVFVACLSMKFAQNSA